MRGATVLFTDRTGGVSRAPYDSANVGFNTGDNLADLAENRRIVRDRFPGPRAWVRAEQVHGADIAYVGRDSLSLQCSDLQGSVGPADGIVTVRPDVSPVIFTADCAPVALSMDGAIAAVHGGWRGLRAGVIERAVETLRSVAGKALAGGSAISAVIGPCIHPCCYEFPKDQLEVMTRRFSDSVEGVTREGRPALDIAAAVRAALERSNVLAIDDVDACTGCNQNYFSHRRDGPTTGRQVMLVALSDAHDS